MAGSGGRESVCSNTQTNHFSSITSVISLRTFGGLFSLKFVKEFKSANMIQIAIFLELCSSFAGQRLRTKKCATERRLGKVLIKTIMLESLDERGFSAWLKNVCDTFRSLSEIQKNSTIQGIIDICGPEQLRFLSTKLEILVKRDYLKCLPLELSFHVLKWLDPVSLCKCCLVSKKWNKVILSCDDVWQNACRQLGMFVKEDLERTSVTTWKQKYMSHVKSMKKLKCEGAVEKKHLYGHKARVFALRYYRDCLATGEIIWLVKTAQSIINLTRAIPFYINHPSHPAPTPHLHPADVVGKKEYVPLKVINIKVPK